MVLLNQITELKPPPNTATSATKTQMQPLIGGMIFNPIAAPKSRSGRFFFCQDSRSLPPSVNVVW